jgi:putative endonuclease
MDIIARKRNVAVFGEVKARRDEMSAIDAVSHTVLNRIRAASDLCWRVKANTFCFRSVTI